jgi:hypothetical protein
MIGPLRLACHTSLFYLICIILICFILLEAIAAYLVCHQRNAIFGRGACIFVLTHFLTARRMHRIKCGAKYYGA